MHDAVVVDDLGFEKPMSSWDARITGILTSNLTVTQDRPVTGSDHWTLRLSRPLNAGEYVTVKWRLAAPAGWAPNGTTWQTVPVAHGSNFADATASAMSYTVQAGFKPTLAFDGMSSGSSMRWLVGAHPIVSLSFATPISSIGEGYSDVVVMNVDSPAAIIVVVPARVEVDTAHLDPSWVYDDATRTLTTTVVRAAGQSTTRWIVQLPVIVVGSPSKTAYTDPVTFTGIATGVVPLGQAEPAAPITVTGQAYLFDPASVVAGVASKCAFGINYPASKGGAGPNYAQDAAFTDRLPCLEYPDANYRASSALDGAS